MADSEVSSVSSRRVLDERHGDVVLADRDRLSLLEVLVGLYPDSSNARELLQAIGYPPGRMPTFDNPGASWFHVFHELDAGVLADPYGRLLRAVLRVYPHHPELRLIAERHRVVAPAPVRPGEATVAPPVQELAPSTCHVIVRADDEAERERVQGVLAGLGLEPVPVWATATAASFRVNATDPRALEVRLDQGATDVGWTVVRPGQPDYLLQTLIVDGPDGRRFRVRDVPAQESISNLAREVIESQYPSPRMLPITVDHVGPDGPQRVDADTTFDESRIRDGDTVRVGYQTNAGGGPLAGGPDPRRHATKRTWPGDDALPDLPSPARDDQRLWMRARTDPEIGLGRTRPVSVTVARESLDSPRTPVRAAAQFDAEPDQKLTIEVVPVANLEVVGSDRAYVDLPRPGEPQQLRFAVRATHVGQGQLWVTASQGQVPLQTLELTPAVVDSPGFDSGEIVLRPPSAPVHVLRIIEQRVGDAVQYRYDLEARDLGLLDTFTSEPIHGDRDTYVRGLFARIERFWGDTNGDTERFEAELRAFGVDLLVELVPRELQAILWRYRDELTNVMVLSSEPFIPWELVHLTDPAAPGSVPTETAFLGQLGLVRWRWRTWPPEELAVRPGRAWVIAPDYPGEYRLDQAAADVAGLRAALGAAPVEPHHRQVLELLQTGGFDLLHFVGHATAGTHGIADAQLLLEGSVDAEGNYVREPLRVSVVARYLHRDHVGGGPLVFLNACQAGRLGHQLTSLGGFAAAFLDGGAGAFVSSLWSVGDAPAATFASAFYDALLDGATMSEAVALGRRAARRSGDATWLAYVVYAHPAARLRVGPAGG